MSLVCRQSSVKPLKQIIVICNTSLSILNLNLVWYIIYFEASLQYSLHNWRFCFELVIGQTNGEEGWPWGLFSFVRAFAASPLTQVSLTKTSWTARYAGYLQYRHQFFLFPVFCFCFYKRTQTFRGMYSTHNCMWLYIHAPHFCFILGSEMHLKKIPIVQP